MNVNGIGKQTYYENTNKAKANPREGGGFYERLSQNLNERAGTEKGKEGAAYPASTVTNTAYPYRNVAAKAETGISGVAESGNTVVGAVTACAVRGISYRESDQVKVFAKEGFSLMAQVDMEKRSVYIERKNEDGTYLAYEVDVDKLEKDSKDPIEQMAIEAWEKGKSEKEEEEELTLAEALQDFYEFVEDRIKNGPPKYLIGNSEFSVAQWDKLMEGVDGQLDAIREDLRERIEQMKAQQMKADASKELESLQDGIRDTENEEIEEELLMSLFQDMSKI